MLLVWGVKITTGRHIHLMKCHLINWWGIHDYVLRVYGGVFDSVPYMQDKFVNMGENFINFNLFM